MSVDNIGITELTLLVSCVGCGAGMMWRLNVIHNALLNAINVSKREIEEKHDEKMSAFNERCEVMQRTFGETCSALRNKVYEVELYMRDNFIRRESFMQIIQAQEKMMSEGWDRIDRRLDKLEDTVRRQHPDVNTAKDKT